MTKAKNLQPYIIDKDFAPSKKFQQTNPGFKLFVFDMRQHQDGFTNLPRKIFGWRSIFPAARKFLEQLFFSL